MEDPNALLDKFTQILAYVGDEGAKDGYYLRRNAAGNSVYSINIRQEPVPEEKIPMLIKKIKNLLKSNKPVTEFPQDIVVKIGELKALFDATADESTKRELIDYISEFGNNSGMHGGLGKKTKRRSKNRKNRKTRSRK